MNLDKEMNLLDLSVGYFESMDYQIMKKDHNLVIGERAGPGGVTEAIIVWIHKEQKGVILEDRYENEFEKAGKDYPKAQMFLLAKTLEGLQPRFRSDAYRKYHVNIRTPIEFFDKEVKEARNPLAKLRDEGEEIQKNRVAQPYKKISGATRNSKGEDLLQDLVKQFEDSRAPCVKIVVGPAGSGKTIFFKSLYACLYRKFMEGKNSKRYIIPRPLPMIPEHLRDAAGVNIGALVDAFLRIELKEVTTRKTIEWMFEKQRAIWLMDGLDELIALDPDFFEYIIKHFTTPEAYPQILICTRDSLLENCANLKDFIEEYPSEIDIFGLEKWEIRSKKALVQLEFKGDKYEKDRQQLLKLITKPGSALEEISSLPYYCKLIIEMFKDKKLQENITDLDLLELSTRSMCNREYEKKLLDRKIIDIDQQLELLECLAVENFLNGNKGVTWKNVEEYAELFLLDPSKTEKKQAITNLKQHSLFTRSEVSENMSFTHEILGQYLLGRELLREFINNGQRLSFVRNVNTDILMADSIALKYLAKEIKRPQWVDLLNLLKAGTLAPTTIGFRNILQILAIATKETPFLRDSKLSVEGADLSCSKFEQLELNGISFRGCNLTYVVFEKCNLRNTKFEGCLIDNTKFVPAHEGDMEGAQFGNLERFYSMWTSKNKFIDDPREALNWIQKETRGKKPPIAPCPAALQLRHLFTKFVRRDGTPRRHKLDVKGVLRGKRFPEAPSPPACLEIATKRGYLNVEEKDYVSRPDRERYSEIVQYVKCFSFSKGLRVLLNDLCSIPDCTHVPSEIRKE